MLRRIVGLALSVLAIGSLVTAAEAATQPPVGSLVCSSTGTVTFSPALPGGTPPSTKATRVKIHKAVLVTCDSTRVSGGKFPITGGTIEFSAVVPAGTDCNTFDPLTVAKPKLVVRLTGLNPKGKPATVAVLRPTIQGVALNILGLIMVGQVPANVGTSAKPFAGQLIQFEADAVDTSGIESCWNLMGTPLESFGFNTGFGLLTN